MKIQEQNIDKTHNQFFKKVPKETPYYEKKYANEIEPLSLN